VIRTPNCGPNSHIWLTAATSSHWRQGMSSLPVPRPLAVVDAHRQLRGPYTAGGELVRLLVPRLAGGRPDLVTAHDIEILRVAPEIRTHLAPTRETLTSTAPPEERIRFYPASWTQRIAHGLTELIRDAAEYLNTGPACIVITTAHAADPTDLELISTMIRRIDPGRLTLVVCTDDTAPPQLLSDALAGYAIRRTVEPVVTDPTGATDVIRERLAEQFVDGDCTSDDPALLVAYQELSTRRRATLHDTRARVLDEQGEASRRLGALPFHLEHGTDPGGAGLTALLSTLEHCSRQGFYHAALDLAHRTFRLLDWSTRGEQRRLVVAKAATALLALGRPDEVAALYDDACASSTLPSVHLQAAYGRAMLYTRFYPPERRDPRKAQGWIETALTLAASQPDQHRRAIDLTLSGNGSALVQMRLGRPQEALRTIDEGLRTLDDQFEPDEHPLLRSVLRSNRAQLLNSLELLQDAAAEYTLAIKADPHHSEYYAERAALYRRLGRWQDALTDLTAAIRESPPYPEAYYNRGDLLFEIGDLPAALTDFGYVVELEPGYPGARINKASIHYQLGERTAARHEVDLGLAEDPGQAELLCLRGHLAVDDNDPLAALQAYQSALAADPTCVAALAGQARVEFDSGNIESAVDDLTRAIELNDDPDLRFNRGLALQRLGRWSKAATDFTAAIDSDLDVAAAAELYYRRAMCHLRQQNGPEAQADFTVCAASDQPPHADRASRWLNRLARPQAS